MFLNTATLGFTLFRFSLYRLFCRWRCMCVLECGSSFSFFLTRMQRYKKNMHLTDSVLLTLFKGINWISGLQVKAINVKIQFLKTHSKFMKILACNNSWKWCVRFFYMYFNLTASSDGIIMIIGAYQQYRGEKLSRWHSISDILAFLFSNKVISLTKKQRSLKLKLLCNLPCCFHSGLCRNLNMSFHLSVKVISIYWKCLYIPAEESMACSSLVAHGLCFWKLFPHLKNIVAYDFIITVEF